MGDFVWGVPSRGWASPAGLDASTVPVLVACLWCGTPHIVCRWRAHVCVHMFLRIIVQTFVSSKSETVTQTRQDISQIRGTSIFLRTEAKGLPPGLHHRRCGRAAMFDDSPGLLRWRCCHGGGFPLQYVRACFMTHSFLTLGFIAYDDVYITIGVSFTMYLVRDDLINKWNHYTISPEM